MPWGNGTGPAGMGPMTGRAAGYCAGYGVPGYANPASGRGYGFGFGRGGGWGRRNWYYATGLTGWQRSGYGYPVAAGYPYVASNAGVPYAPTKEQQTDMLKGQAEYLEDQLAGIKKRLEELEKEKK
ncbi:MAG: hypothetical protein GF350_16340 [Chitinivibrionales bacterium]|nr:hypothetical protein [Chitinivibrionales bacterium]